MTHELIKKNIDEYINEMPSLPISVQKVMEICGKMQVNPSELNNVISLDPVLTGSLLKLINSAYYGLSWHITSLVRAVIMLGINTVKNLALSTAVLATLPKNKDHSGLNMEGFWRHCLCVGVTAKLLAKKQGVEAEFVEEYFTAGLLHDIGKIPLSAVLSADYLEAVTDAGSEQKSLYNTENSRFNINHCITGEMIVNAWKLNGPIADIITYHHNVTGYSGKNSGILHNIAIANYLSSIYEVGFSGDINPEKPDNKIWEASGVKQDIFKELKDKVETEIKKAEIFLHISQGG